ncbi:hypothetical protein FAF44_19770 [Nonomuraea sp. MG754425]|uniref:hypothetical protein n=1 Tax=Nonomuraea sp. MG754425 TaxID=2570319 RepID=UPI001F1ECBEB|nr:hypothetical protein [Nonomuraea sp. MG754425]MCF6470619.1 hypothetical protein [Nonomuraea sp. MG754425]
MRKAVARVDVDPNRSLTADRIAAGVARLAARGLVLRRHPEERVLTLTLDGESRERARQRLVTACETAFGTTPAVGVVTFASRGTDEDALGVIEAFGVQADVERLQEDGAEVAVFTIPSAERRRVPESRLHTALEAALNCEIRIRYA